MIYPETPPRTGAVALLAAAAGAAALLPAAVLIGCGVLGVAVPRLISSPIVVFGGLGFALLVNVGAKIRWRARATRDELAMECDVRLHYRGVNRVVAIAGLALVTIVVLYVLAESFGAR